jgi:hypothetical protein
VSGEELDQLLSLLDEALSARRSADGARRARTADGRLEIALRLPADDRPWVVLKTPSGRLRCRDYRLEVAPALGAVEPAAEEVAT